MEGRVLAVLGQWSQGGRNAIAPLSRWTERSVAAGIEKRAVEVPEADSEPERQNPAEKHRERIGAEPLEPLGVEVDSAEDGCDIDHPAPVLRDRPDANRNQRQCPQDHVDEVVDLDAEPL